MWSLVHMLGRGLVSTTYIKTWKRGWTGSFRKFDKHWWTDYMYICTNVAFKFHQSAPWDTIDRRLILWQTLSLYTNRIWSGSDQSIDNVVILPKMNRQICAFSFFPCYTRFWPIYWHSLICWGMDEQSHEGFMWNVITYTYIHNFHSGFTITAFEVMAWMGNWIPLSPYLSPNASLDSRC